MGRRCLRAHPPTSSLLLPLSIMETRSGLGNEVKYYRLVRRSFASRRRESVSPPSCGASPDALGVEGADASGRGGNTVGIRDAVGVAGVEVVVVPLRSRFSALPSAVPRSSLLAPRLARSFASNRLPSSRGPSATVRGERVRRSPTQTRAASHSRCPKSTRRTATSQRKRIHNKPTRHYHNRCAFCTWKGGRVNNADGSSRVRTSPPVCAAKLAINPASTSCKRYSGE